MDEKAYGQLVGGALPSASDWHLRQQALNVSMGLDHAGKRNAEQIVGDAEKLLVFLKGSETAPSKSN